MDKKNRRVILIKTGIILIRRLNQASLEAQHSYTMVKYFGVMIGLKIVLNG